MDTSKIISPSKVERNYNFNFKLYKKYNFKNPFILKLKKIIKLVFKF